MMKCRAGIYSSFSGLSAPSKEPCSSDTSIPEARIPSTIRSVALSSTSSAVRGSGLREGGVE